MYHSKNMQLFKVSICTVP